MRLSCLAIVLSACAKPAAVPERPAPPPVVVLAGRVIDPAGTPIAGAEVLVCVAVSGCGPVVMRSLSSPATIAELIAEVPASWPRSQIAYAKTDAAGRWQTRAPGSTQLEIVATAPGRELAEQLIGPDGEIDDLALRPAGSVDIDAWCGADPCTGKVLVARARFVNSGTHLERLIAGSHTLVVRAQSGEPGEHLGSVTVEVGPEPQQVRADLQPTGTGLAITGRVDRCGKPCSVEVSCGSADTPLFRHTKVGRDGRFELLDVPPPPCVVRAMGYEPPGYDGVPERHPSTRAKVDHLPARLDLELRDD